MSFPNISPFKIKPVFNFICMVPDITVNKHIYKESSGKNLKNAVSIPSGSLCASLVNPVQSEAYKMVV